MTGLASHAGPPSGRLPVWLCGGALVAALSGYAIAVADFNALFVCVALLACLFTLLDFRVGAILLIVVMPVSASQLFPHSIAGLTGFNPLNLLLIATTAAWLLQSPEKGSVARLLSPRLKWYVLPMLAAALLGLPHVGEIPPYFYAENLVAFDSASGYLRDMLVKPLFMVLFAVLVGAAVARSRRGDGFLVPMLVSVWIMGLMTIVFVHLSGASFAELASSGARGFFLPLGMHANDLGRCYAVAYALMLFTLAGSRDPRMRAALLVTMGMLVVALVLTFSRGAFLGFAVVNILFLLSRRNIVALLAGGLLLAGLAFFLPDAVYERIGSGWEHGLNAVSAGRIDEIWLPLLPELWNSPVWGHGLGSILWSDAMRAGGMQQVTHPHNAYLQAMLDMGVLGLVLVGAYFVHVWREFRRLSADSALSPAQRGFHEGAAAGLLSFLLAGVAGSSLLPVPEQVFLWLAIGVMYGDRARQAEARHVRNE